MFSSSYVFKWGGLLRPLVYTLVPLLSRLGCCGFVYRFGYLVGNHLRRLVHVPQYLHQKGGFLP